MPLAASIRIAPLSTLADRDEAARGIEAIFVETSGAKGPDRDAAFRERWLGRYLVRYPDEVFVALAAGDTVIGYLVGCLDDPAHNALFADISYFSTFQHLTRRFPAHLHVNLTACYRSRGIGARLVEAFAGHATRAGAPGMHAVTGEGARNNRFYVTCGFEQLQSASWNGKAIAFFGRRLAGSRERPPA